jgi:hypothetical protein
MTRSGGHGTDTVISVRAAGNPAYAGGLIHQQQLQRLQPAQWHDLLDSLKCAVDGDSQQNRFDLNG